MKKNIVPIIIGILSVICLISIGVMVVAINETKASAQAEFVPPEFDQEAVVGVPEVDANLGWSRLFKEGMSFAASVCGNVIVKDNKADIYFTSEEANEVWIKLRVLNQSGDILGETGLLKPGEYVKSINFTGPVTDGEPIVFKIMSYEIDTYYSMGSITVNTVATVTN